MKYWNSSQPCTIPSDLLADDAFDTAGARPEKVTIPPYAIVEVKPEYGLRRRGMSTPEPRKAVIEELTGGRMRPYDDEAKQLYSATFHDQLPHIMLAHAKTAVGYDGAAGENISTATDRERERERKLNEEVGRRTRAAQGEQERAAQPNANVLFTLDER